MVWLRHSPPPDKQSLSHVKHSMGLLVFCNTFVLHTWHNLVDKLVPVMCMRKFRLPCVPPTTTKSIRFPNDVIEQVEHAIRGKDCTFTAFVVEAVRVALDNLQDEER